MPGLGPAGIAACPAGVAGGCRRPLLIGAARARFQGPPRAHAARKGGEPRPDQMGNRCAVRLAAARLSRAPRGIARAGAAVPCWPWPCRCSWSRASAGSGGLAGQGHRRLRRRAQQHAGRLRPGRGPQRHRRPPAQRRVHPGEPGRDAGAAGRGDPGRHPQHQERGRGHGDRRPCRRSRARAAGSTSRSSAWATRSRCSAARSWSPRCSVPTARPTRWRKGAERRRVRGRRAKRKRSPAACRPPPGSFERCHGRAEVRSTIWSLVRLACATPTSPPPSGSPPRSTTASGAGAAALDLYHGGRAVLPAAATGAVAELVTEIERIEWSRTRRRGS